MIATASKDMTVCIWAATETGAFRYTLSPLVREERERRIGTCVRGREGGGNDDPHAAFFLTGNLFARVPSLTTHALMNLTPLPLLHNLSFIVYLFDFSDLSRVGDALSVPRFAFPSLLLSRCDL